jgi:hypothetical protein
VACYGPQQEARRVTTCTRITRMRFIKDGHPLALGIKGIQDNVMDEDDKAKVKSKDPCVIKMKAQRAPKFIRQAEAAVVKIGIYIKDRTVLA